MVDRSGHGETNPTHGVGGAPRLDEQGGEPAAEGVEDRAGSGGDVEGTGVLGEEFPAEGEDGGAGVPGLQVGGEDEAVAVVELQPYGGASAERGAAGVGRALAQPSGAEEPVEAVADGGAGESGGLLEGAARGGAAAPDEGKQIPRTGPGTGLSGRTRHVLPPCAHQLCITQ